ncbi:hypothetical protein SDC9_12836 [bioreactor metagenome]|uniref:Signaling protein n=1 Tax=bioreactor metagenome TaxID=1076179 RepID=A0A644TJN0_9ZZZZ|nr:EAL domain-containing protein [Acidaminococcaceae bacterium]
MYGSKQNKIEDMLSKISGAVWELSAVEDIFVYFVNEGKKTCTLKMSTGIFTNFKMTSSFEKNILEQLYAIKRMVILDNPSFKNLCLDTSILNQISCLIILPLMYEDKLLGLVGTAFKKSGDAVENKELSLLQEFIDLAGISLGKILEEYNLQKIIRNQKKEIKGLEQTEDKYAQMFYMSPDAIALMHADGTFVEVNHSFTLITGFSKEEAIGKTLKDLGVWFNIADRKRILKLLSSPDEIEKIEVPIYKKNGQIVHTQVLARRVNLNKKPYYIVVGRDISNQVEAENKRMEQVETIKHMAYFDPLTDIPNRNNLHGWLAKELEKIKTGKTKGVVFSIDMDDLKIINDAYGHDLGNKILITASNRIIEAVGQKTFVSRTGGDEFVVVVQGKYSQKKVEFIAEKISKNVNKKQEYLDMSLHTTVSIGIAYYPRDGETVEEIIKHAEDARYEAKKNGKNCWKFYNKEMQDEAYKNMRMIEGLRYAIERRELSVVYQPQITLPQRTVGGVEALLRWHSQEYGNVSPEIFIPLAEQAGFINSIGKWVLTEACFFASRLAQQGRGDVRVAVNISARQVASGDFVRTLCNAVKTAGILPKQLEIEITESLLIDSLDEAISKLNKSKKLGFNLALDDFGTGYSSLTYLRKLPVETIKIDKSFIDMIDNDVPGAKMIGAIINMANAINMTVVAEGVETESQLSYLVKEGCSCVQGYFFSKPLKEQDAYKFIQTYNKGL